jgi:nucleoporin NUP2
LATTPAASTPEPSGTAAAAAAQEGQGTDADGDDAPQEQISLTDGGPGEEEEHAVFEVRAKAVKLVPGGAAGGDSEDDSGSSKEAKSAAKSKSPWVVQGVGPLRLLKHKTTGSVRMLLRAEPRGNVAMNKLVLPDFTYKAEAKYVKIAAAKDDGKGLETWMLQVKTPESAKELAAALEEHKVANKKKEGKEKETEEKKDKE